VLHDRVLVGADATIRESVLGEGVRVGERARIEPGAMIGARAEIGEGALIGERARLDPGASIAAGERVEEDARVAPRGGPEGVAR
jgi:UDP-3-O-[3-hydroxymyristoyl] glucosamine N-acyltransferase